MATTPFPTGGYTPNSADSTQPTEDKLVVTAAAEFRGIKRRLNQSIPPGGGVGIPPGGSRNAVLTKLSDGDYDAAWIDLGDIVGEDGDSLLYPNYFELAGSANRTTPGAFQSYALGFGSDFDTAAGYYTIPATGIYIINATFVIGPVVPVTVPTAHSVGVEVYDADGTVYGTFLTDMIVQPGVVGYGTVTKRMGYTGKLEAGLRVRCVHHTPIDGQAGTYSPIAVRQFTGVHIEKGGLGSGGGGSGGSDIVQVACSDLTTPISALEYAGFFAAANAMTLTAIRADLRTASVTGPVELRVRRGFPALDLLVANLVIPEGERSAVSTTLQGSANTLEVGAPVYVDIIAPGVGATGLLVSFSTAAPEVAAPGPAPSPVPPPPTPGPATVSTLQQAIDYIKANPQLFYKGEVVLTTGNKIARANAVLAEDGIDTLHYIDQTFALSEIPLASTTSTVFFMPFACDPDGEIGRWGFADSGAAPKFVVNSLSLDDSVIADVKEAFPRLNESNSGIEFADEVWGRNYGPQQREIYTVSGAIDIKGITQTRNYHQGRNTSTDAPTVLALPFTWTKVDDSGAIPFTVGESGLNVINEGVSEFDVQVGDLVIGWTVLAKHPVDAVPVLDADLIYSWTRQRNNADGQNFYGMSLWFAKTATSYSISRAKANFPGNRFVVYRKTAN